MSDERRCGGSDSARLATLLGALTVVWACNAPFIPVPPPGATFTSQLTDDGMGGQKTVWITHGLPSSHAALARYSVFNQTTGEGVVATAAADGTFTADPMDGTMNDHVQVYYRDAGRRLQRVDLSLVDDRRRRGRLRRRPARRSRAGAGPLRARSATRPG